MFQNLFSSSTIAPKEVGYNFCVIDLWSVSKLSSGHSVLPPRSMMRDRKIMISKRPKMRQSALPLPKSLNCKPTNTPKPRNNGKNINVTDKSTNDHATIQQNRISCQSWHISHPVRRQTAITPVATLAWPGCDQYMVLYPARNG